MNRRGFLASAASLLAGAGLPLPFAKPVEAALPTIVGAIRFSPPAVAGEAIWTELGDAYVRDTFYFGTGMFGSISDVRIGETPIEEFEDCSWEIERRDDGGVYGHLFIRASDQLSGRPSVSAQIERWPAVVCKPLTGSRQAQNDAAHDGLQPNESSVFADLPHFPFLPAADISPDAVWHSRQRRSPGSDPR